MFRLLLLLLLMSGCAVTPSGKQVDRSNLADVSTTAIALVTKSGYEANPLAKVTLPLKLIQGRMIDRLECESRVKWARRISSFLYGISANNLAVFLGSKDAPAIGLAAGTAYYVKSENAEVCNGKIPRLD